MDTIAIKRISLFAAWLVAFTAVMATLYSSEILEYPVCHLCWYQRICIYPLVLILGIATFRDDGKIAIYAAPLTIIGAFFALYQYIEQMFPGFGPIKFCSAGVSCSYIHIKLFGFMTFPFLSLAACVVMFVLLLVSYRAEPQ